MKVRFNRYVHCDKSDNYDLERHFGDPKLRYCGYEEELIYEYDTETGQLELIGANGKFLSDEQITPGELTEIDEEFRS